MVRQKANSCGFCGATLAAMLAWGTTLCAAAVDEPDEPDRGEVAAAAAALSGPRDLWTLLGVDESHFEQLTDGVPWHESEDGVLLKMLSRLPDFRLEEIEDWARDDFQSGPLPDDLDAIRGEVFRLRGRVERVEAIRLPADLAARYEMEEYYRCDFRVEGAAGAAVVFARTVPSAWKREGPIDEQAGVLGFFLKSAAGEDGPGEPVFASRRVAWYPDTRLGALGMDVGLLDDVRSLRSGDLPEATPKLRNMRLTSRNRECFYQMLAAAGRAEPGQLIRDAEQELRPSGGEQFSVVPLFNEPGGQHGRLVVLSGRAREVVMVRVADEDVRARFGIDHYYQVSLFTDDSLGNPVIFCVRELPEGMPVGKGPQYGEYVTAAGFFFNTWAFRSQLPHESAEAASQWQLAPLLIGRDVLWFPRQTPARNPLAGAVAGGLFVLLLLVVWLLLWRYSRGDKQFHDRTLSRHLGGEPDTSLDELGIDVSDKPDFSGLDED